MLRGVSFVVSFGLMMTRKILLRWVISGIIPGGSSVARILFSCPKYSVSFKKSFLFGLCSYTSLSNEYYIDGVEWGVTERCDVTHSDKSGITMISVFFCLTLVAGGTDLVSICDCNLLVFFKIHEEAFPELILSLLVFQVESCDQA